MINNPVIYTKSNPYPYKFNIGYFPGYSSMECTYADGTTEYLEPYTAQTYIFMASTNPVVVKIQYIDDQHGKIEVIGIENGPAEIDVVCTTAGGIDAYLSGFSYRIDNGTDITVPSDGSVHTVNVQVDTDVYHRIIVFASTYLD